MRIFLLLFTILSLTLSAQVTIAENKECNNTFNIEYYYDSSSNLTIDDIQNKKFLTTKNNFTFGYLSGTTWFKIVLENNSSQQDFILNFSETLWKSFNLYEYQDNRWQIQYNGLDVPLSKRSFKSIYPTFKLHIPTNTKKTLYVQGQTVSGQLGKFQICTLESYYGSKFEVVDLYIIFAFSLLSIFILNLYSYFLMREKVYLYYVAYTFVLIIFSAMQSGFYLLFGLPGWNEGLHVVGTFIPITLILFSDTFLHVEEHLKWAHKFFQFSIAVFLVFAILIFYNVPHTSLAFNIYSIGFFSVLFYATIKACFKGYSGVRYYLIALIIYLLMMGIMILTFNAFLEYTLINRHLYVLGAFIEIIFFTLILANRYRTISLEKLKIQEELLVEKNKNEEVLKVAVEERTNELEIAKSKLETLVRTDHLTKIKNRRAYKDRINDLLSLYNRYGTTFSMLIFDIDDFKVINDTYGHKMGDIVLIELAALISNNIRKNDYFFRIGGEEFVILLDETGLDKAKKLTEHLLDIVSNKLMLIKDHKITISIGLTEVKKGDTETSMYQRTDALLYKSKKNGKNQVSF